MDERAKAFPDRRLGSSWYGWDGNVARHEGALNEGPLLYLALLGAFLGGVCLAGISVMWFLSRFSASLLTLSIDAVVAALVLTISVSFVLCSDAVLGGRCFPYAWFSKALTMMVPMLVFLARPLGLSRDRISSSCIAATNSVSQGRLRRIENERPLILLPRCLTRSCVAEIRRLAAPYGCAVVLVGTNDQARARMREFQPSSVIAVACERDLVRGLYDYGRHIPILVIANQRPKGPCLEATIDMAQLQRALEALGVAPESRPTEDAAEEPVEEAVVSK